MGPQFKEICLLFAFAALTQGQEAVNRTFAFAHADTPQAWQEIATILRSVADIPQVSVDAPKRSLSLRASTEQVAVAEWLFHELDRAPDRGSGGVNTSTPSEYKTSPRGDDIVRLFDLQPNSTPQEVQETSTVLRSMGDIRRVFVYNASRKIVVRGDRDQIAFSEWLVAKLYAARAARVAPASSESTEFRAKENRDSQVRLFPVSTSLSDQDLQEIATILRSIADIRYVFTHTATRAIVLRASPEQVAMAEWLVRELDQPANQPAASPVTNSASGEYSGGSSADDVVRVFYVKRSQTPQELQETAVRVRVGTGVRRLFTYHRPKALTVRGTREQLTEANRLVMNPLLRQ
jgi:hypothetical protein